MGTKGLQGRLAVKDDTLSSTPDSWPSIPGRPAPWRGSWRTTSGCRFGRHQFAGQWLPLSEEDRSRLGVKEANSALGVNTVLGARVWDQQAKFELRVGPLTFAEFSDFLPSGTAFRPLVQLTRFFAGQEFDFDVQLILARQKCLGAAWAQRGANASRLGWSTWLKTRESSEDIDNAVLTGDLTRLGAFPE